MRPSLTNRRVLLGISGGIAAYKSAEIVRRLQDQGADVRVVMTSAAQAFITPLTLQALSGKPVATDLLDTEAEAAMGHIELARWADLILIAPASADIIARLAQGNADDLLTTVCLASRCPIAIAPAMNQAMWHAEGTQQNLQILAERKIRQFGPAGGEQACGDVGLGRMEEPLELVRAVADVFHTRELEGKHVVITAGPTREAIDPVRYISNHSSGKMGYALAQAALDAGAKVTLITGPTSLNPPERANTRQVVAAEEMFTEVMAAIAHCDIFIGTAAVADYRPVMVADQKIKKTAQDKIMLQLEKTPDIIASVTASRLVPYVVGFAAETEQIEQYAREKLQRKQLNMVIANDVSDQCIGFNSDDNEVSLIAHDSLFRLPRSSKKQLAVDIITHIAQQLS